MQCIKSILDLGFTLNEENEYQLNGRHQVFIATHYNEHPSYVGLRVFSDRIDDRPLSPRKGKYLFHTIKDCCSDGSLKKAIERYDVPAFKLKFVIGGAIVLN